MKKLAIFLFTTFSIALYSQQILPENERARVIDEILSDRFNNLLPELMDKADIDMWILISREYNEDRAQDHVAINLVKCQKAHYFAFPSK